MNSTSTRRNRPWTWVPSLYFAEGLPYVAVTFIAVIMYKRLGMGNAEIAFYTSWLGLPWVIKPLWSPFVDLLGTRRAWVIGMQSLVAAGFAGVAFFIPTTGYVQATMAFFWLLAFASATHDIAADGFYILALTEGDRSFFVGIRNTFYRLAMIFGQGLLVMLAGLLEDGRILPRTAGNIPLAWSLVFYLMAALFIGLALWHRRALPHAPADVARKGVGAGELLRNFGLTFASFFRKKEVGLMFFFLLTYRLGEAQLVKIASPFLLDHRATGGIGLSTSAVGLIYGTIGVIALLAGGIVGGIVVSRGGLRRWILPMALAINLPDLLYVWLAATQPTGAWMPGLCVAIEQLGYGFGFAAFTLFLIYVARGQHSTAHYAIGTGFMALGMMLPGMAAGWLQQVLGYTAFFGWVCVSTLPGIVAAMMVRKSLPADFGRNH
ncbi:MFS transporter [Bacteroides sp. OttesenSCG-928-E20]|nr:MFS transporter [Bacteroides sp. OttesenSCG-928-N06]MDL2299412.1 MFS transporter [Bacteroides sp. OttesenSCG-928-E20]MDL2304177.1 MFS transporter [Bacteroides sp. OttesenSCG-928-D19]